MKKLSLLLALMLVLTSCFFVACGDDEEETKAPVLNNNAGNNTNNGNNTNTGNSSTPADDSSSAPADDSSSTPADDSSAPADDEPLTIEGTVVSTNLEYTYPQNDAGTHGARAYTGNVADGIIPEAFMDANTGLPSAAWFGLFNNAGALADTNALEGYGEFSFDLGSAKALTGVKAYIGWSASYEPVVLTAYVSNDGSTWTELGEMTEMDKVINDPADGAGVYTRGIAIDGSYQFVKVKMTCPSGTYWSFIGEIEIYAAE